MTAWGMATRREFFMSQRKAINSASIFTVWELRDNAVMGQWLMWYAGNARISRN